MFENSCLKWTLSCSEQWRGEYRFLFCYGNYGKTSSLFMEWPNERVCNSFLLTLSLPVAALQRWAFVTQQCGYKRFSQPVYRCIWWSWSFIHWLIHSAGVLQHAVRLTSWILLAQACRTRDAVTGSERPAWIRISTTQTATCTDQRSPTLHLQTRSLGFYPPVNLRQVTQAWVKGGFPE